MSDASRTDVGQPEWRAALLAEAIRRTAFVEGPINPFRLARALREWLSLSEEDCGDEVYTTLFLMVRSGLYTSNTHDVVTGVISLGGDTRLTVAPVLTTYLHGEVEHAED